MSGKNTGIAYERLVQEIYTQILKQENVKNIEVKHNVIIKGKTVNHQIDVYWEFEMAGIISKTTDSLGAQTRTIFGCIRKNTTRRTCLFYGTGKTCPIA